MTLIKSISGIRGTIGGKPNENLTPLDIVKFVSSYALLLKDENKKLKVCVGIDARISGEMVSQIAQNTLISMGIDVINLGLTTTPSVAMYVILNKLDGGIIITASHNPAEWNALKFLNNKGEFISKNFGAELLKLSEQNNFEYSKVESLGKIEFKNDSLDVHIESILKMPEVDKNLIEKSNFKVSLDGINSSGGIAVPMLLEKLGVKNIVKINCVPNGKFAHNPEPLAENLTEICNITKAEKCDLGIVVDPDVDRLAFICENGEMFGEEYTLVAVADYLLEFYGGGNTVSNLSSTRALKDVTEKYKGKYSSSAVGELNVVEKMKETNSLIGGEGNGGVIYPKHHSGRDALLGIAIFLTFLAKKNLKVTELRKLYPNYFMSKLKVDLKDGTNVNKLLESIKNENKNEEINTLDGIKIIFEKTKEWVHLRPSNTEPIIRVYAESTTQEKADKLGNLFMKRLISNEK